MHLLIADDHTLFRDALVEFMRRETPSAQVAVAKSLPEAMEQMMILGSVDLVLLDLRMPGMAGLDGISDMLAQYPKQKIAILSGTAEEEDVKGALDRGAVAYFPKTMSATSLLRAIKLVMDGERYVPLGQQGSEVMPSHYADAPVALTSAADKALLETLTPREREVLVFLGRGASNKEIARDLNLQLPTIKLHVAGVCRKLGAKNRTQAALFAQNMGLA
jgi:DNA-binding NarL/FixJ family response regulator